MREQSCASGGKAVKLGLTNIPPVSTNSFFGIALRSRRRQTQTDLPMAFLWTGRHGALRAGLLASTPRRRTASGLPVLQNCALGKIPQNPMPEMPANSGSPRVEPRSQSRTCLRVSRRKQRGKPHLQFEIYIHGVPHLPGPEKTRFPSRSFSARGALGVAVGVVLGLGFARLIPTH